MQVDHSLQAAHLGNLEQLQAFRRAMLGGLEQYREILRKDGVGTAD
jgi:hypothetical protein